MDHKKSNVPLITEPDASKNLGKEKKKFEGR